MVPEPRREAHRLLRPVIEKAATTTNRIIEDACRRHPEQAIAIRTGFDRLRSSGLLGPMAGPLGEIHPSSGTNENVTGKKTDSLCQAMQGRYRFIRELGRGGQAVVYLADDLREDRRVALKVVRNTGPLDANRIARLQREATLMARLEHPGICPLYEAGASEHAVWIAMPFIEGASLEERIADATERGTKAKDDEPERVGPFALEDLQTVLALVERAARALHAAHEAGVIHRDLKPANILVTPAGTPVIVDFGLARLDDDGASSLTRSHDVLGTPAYMSPEQLVTKSSLLDRRTDIYSLGVILFECVTLRRPFRARSREALHHAIRFQPTPHLRRYDRRLPQDLQSVVDVALAKDANHRYQTAEELADDLRRIRNRSRVSVRRASALLRMLESLRRRPGRTCVLIILVLGLLLTAALTGFLVANASVIQKVEEHDRLLRVERHLEAGFDSLAHGDPRIALAAFEGALELVKNNKEAIGGMALALLRLEEFTRCLAFLAQHAGSLSDAEGTMRRLAATALRGLNRDDEAEVIERKSQVEPRTSLGYFLAGSHLLQDCQSSPPREPLERAAHLSWKAVLSSPRARILYLDQLSHALGHLGDKPEALDVSQALWTLSPDSRTAARWAAFGLTTTSAPLNTANQTLLDAIVARHPEEPAIRGYLGNHLARQGKYHEAASAFRRAIALGAEGKGEDIVPESIYHGLAMALFQTDNLEEGVAVLREAVSVHPTSSRAYHNLATALLELGKHAEAAEAARRAIALRPHDARVHLRLGQALAACGDSRDAVKSLELALELAIRSPDVGTQVDAFDTLVDIRFKQGRSTEALRLAESRLRLRPDTHGYANIGLIQCQRMKFAEAAEAYRQAIALDSTNPIHHYELSRILMLLGQPASAARHAVRSLTYRPDDAWCRLLLGQALVRTGRFYEAAPQFARAASLFERSGEEQSQAIALGELGACLGATGRFLESVPVLQRAIEIEPDGLRLRNLGIALRELDQSSEAADAFLRALPYFPKDADFHAFLGSFLLRLGQFREAVPVLHTGWTLREDDDRMFTDLALALAGANQASDALAITRARLRADESHAGARYALGVMLLFTGRADEALPWLSSGHASGIGLDDWTFPSATVLRLCEDTVLRDVRTALVDGWNGKSLELRLHTLDRLTAVLESWERSTSRPQEKAAIGSRLASIFARDDLRAFRTLAVFEELAVDERQRWVDIWTLLVDLRNRVGEGN